jgi:hypothetical protein
MNLEVADGKFGLMIGAVVMQYQINQYDFR